jgi:peptide/nickel transport system substrate-binding protein
VGGFPTFQMKAGSLEKPEQFVVVDEHTFRVNFLRADKLTMPDMAVPVPRSSTPTLAKKHATEKDPWAPDWLKTNEAGGGAYKVEPAGSRARSSSSSALRTGRAARCPRSAHRPARVPSAGNRRALLRAGDIDMTYEMPPKDFLELSADRRRSKWPAPRSRTRCSTSA